MEGAPTPLVEEVQRYLAGVRATLRGELQGAQVGGACAGCVRCCVCNVCVAAAAAPLLLLPLPCWCYCVG